MLESVELHLTNACTHYCPYCYMNANMDPEKTEYADISTIISIIEKLHAFGVGYVCLVGGDPVEHPDIEGIIEEIHNRGMTVSVMSNTAKFKNPQRIAKIVDVFDSTIHGRNADEHDAFCGCLGAYDLLTENLKYFSDCGRQIDIAVNIIPQTYDKAYGIVEGIVKKGIHVSSLLTQRILPYGRASNSTCWNTTPDQVNFFFQEAERARKDFGIEISAEDPYPLCCLDKQYHKYMHGCPEGNNRMAIGMHGEIFRCGAEPLPQSVNMLTSSLEYIWNDSDVFDAFRSKRYLPIECRDCSLLDTCRCGCPISCEKCTINGWHLRKQ